MLLTRPRVPYYGWVTVAVGAPINGISAIDGATSSASFLPLTTHLGVRHGSLAFAPLDAIEGETAASR